MVDLIPKQHYQNLFDSATNNNNNLRPITKKVKSDKTIVKTEEKPQNEEYLRHESQIKDLREVIQNLKIKMKSNRSEKAYIALGSPSSSKGTSTGSSISSSFGAGCTCSSTSLILESSYTSTFP
jgi:hypothetical protein